MPGVAPQPSPGAKYKSPEQPGFPLLGLRPAAQTDGCMLIIRTINPAGSTGKGAERGELCPEGGINSPPLPSLPGLGSSRPGRVWVWPCRGEYGGNMGGYGGSSTVVKQLPGATQVDRSHIPASGLHPVHLSFLAPSLCQDKQVPPGLPFNPSWACT